MKTIYLVLWISVLFFVSCSKEDNSTNDTFESTSGCPSGSFISRDRFNEIYVGKSGVISLDLNRCTSTGFITCHGNGSFTLTIEEKDSIAIDVNECQGIGEFQCEYTNAGSNTVVYCPVGPKGVVNRFKPAMAIEPN